MTRTQIQLPDEVYARAKRLCEAREISLDRNNAHHLGQRIA
jgi:hypothetical protein